MSRPSLLLCGALAVACAAPPAVFAQNPACGFSLTPPQDATSIAGPEDVTSRLHIVSQPTSPIEIIAADFTGAQFVASQDARESRYTFHQSVVIDVRNRSDRTIEHIEARLTAGTCQNAGRTGAPAWTGRLSPGETVRIRMGQGSSSGTTGVGRGSVRIWLSIDRVDFDDCIYRPAQIVPRAACGPGGR